ncbi:putative quinol monooxygenase [Lentzea sp. NPDC060358]|uniref:putative quinol monooxygenase n=1 Tax=Lentzea sp. NPDC060358 TaxID=3347103 RepID=UPI003662185E
MLSIICRFRVKPEWADKWLELTSDFTEATRAERANLWFVWTRNVDEPTEFFLIEAHHEELVEEHLGNPLIPRIVAEWPQALVEQPTMLMTTIAGTEWQLMDRMPVPAASTAAAGEQRR